MAVTVATSLDGNVFGAVQIKQPDSLNATLTTASPSGWAAKVHTAAGGCGTKCYRTTVNLVVTG